MKRLVLVAFHLAAFAVPAAALAASPSTGDGAPSWAVAELSAWLAAYNARDASRIGAFYSPEAVLRPFGKAPIRGRAAIVEHYREGLAAETAVCAGGFDGFKVAADVAVGWGYDRCDYPAAGGVRPPPYHARWMLIFERDPSGHWLIAQDIDEGEAT